MDNFDYKKYLKEGRLLKEDESLEDMNLQRRRYGLMYMIDASKDSLRSAFEDLEYAPSAAPMKDQINILKNETISKLLGILNIDDEMLSVNEGPGQKHYTKDGKEWTGPTHKMPDGTLMTGDPHNDDSEELSHESVNEVQEEPIVGLLEIGMFASRGMGEKKLVELSDAFENIGDEQADAIASPLNMAIELMQDGESKSAIPHFKEFNKACQKELKLMKEQGLAESIDDSESYFTGHVDQIAQAEFGMDFHQLGRGEKEWVRDEIDNMTMQENEEGEKILTSRNKLEQTLNDISDELTDDQLDTISNMIVDLSSEIKKTIKK